MIELMLVLLKLVTVRASLDDIITANDRNTISTEYRPIPPIDADLLKDERCVKLEFLWCTIQDCNTPFKNEIAEDDVVCLVIDDVIGLTDSTIFAERIGIGCAKMKYLSILVRWDQLQPNYYQAVANSHGVASQVYKHLLKEHKVAHLIGLGVGAHIAGFIGKLSKENGRIHRITGIDPNRILFEYNNGPAELRLDKEDAVFVDIYHTDYRGKMRFGFIQNIGNVDFYEIGSSNCKRAPMPPGDALDLWKDPYGPLFEKVSKCMHNFAALNFLSMMSKNCSLYAVRNIKDPCTKTNCVGMGFLSHAYVLHSLTGGDSGNYVYNASHCTWGVPYTTYGDNAFREVYDAWNVGPHPLIDDRDWIEWAYDAGRTGIGWSIDKVTGIYHGMTATVPWDSLPTFGLPNLADYLKFPKVPSFPPLPSFSWMIPSLPSLPGMPSVSSLPGIPSLNPLNYVPDFLNPIKYIPSIG